MILAEEGRCISSVDFSISAGISTTGVALEPSMFKMIWYTKFSGTGWNENYSLVLTVLLILSILGWELKESSTSSKVFALFHYLFSSKLLVILIKKLFIIVANCFLFETRFPFSLRRNLFEFIPLLLKHVLVVFLIFLLLDKSRMFKFWK